MIATVSPSSGSYSETVNTLRYAQRAKHIINKPKMNAINNDETNKTIHELREEVAKLRDALAKIQMNGTVHSKHIISPCADHCVGPTAKRWIARYHRHISSLQHPCPQSYSTTLKFFMGQSSSSVGEATAAPPLEEAVEVKEVPCTFLPVMLLDHAAQSNLRLSSSCDLIYRTPTRKISRSQHRDYSSQDSIQADSVLSPENSLGSSSSSLESNRSLDSRKGTLIGASNIYKNKPGVRSGIPVRVRSASSPDLTVEKSKKRTKQDIVADVTKRLYPIKKIRERALAAAAAASSEDGETCSKAANRLRELSKRLLDAHRRAKGKVEVETQTEKEQNTKEAAVETDNRFPTALLASDILLPVCLLHSCGSPEVLTAVQPDLLDQCRSCEKLSEEFFSDDSLENCVHKSMETDSLDDVLDNSPKQKIMYQTNLGSQHGWEVKLEVSSDDGVVKVVHSSDDSRPQSSDDNNSCPSPLSSEGGSLGSDSSGDDILYFMQSPQAEDGSPEVQSNQFERSLYTILESSEHSSDQSTSTSPTGITFEARKSSSSPAMDRNKNFTIEITNNNGACNSNFLPANSPTCSITFNDANCNQVHRKTPEREILFEGELKIRPKFALGHILTQQVQQHKPTVCYPNDSARLISNSFYPEFTKGLEEMSVNNSPKFSSPLKFETETTYANTSPRISSSSSSEEILNNNSPTPSPKFKVNGPINFDATTEPQEIRSEEDLATTRSYKFPSNQYLNEEEIYEIKKIPDARDPSADSLKSNQNMAQLPGVETKKEASHQPVANEAASVPWADPNQRKFLNISVTTPARGPCVVRRDASFNSDDSITFVFVGPNQKNSPPVLMELIQRSSKGLRRSLSLDSATRALGKISKSAKSEANRASSTNDLLPEETRSFLEPKKTFEGPNHNFKRLRREALTPSDSEVRSTDDDFDDSPPPEFPKSTGFDTNQCWAEMKGIILGRQVRQPSNSPSPPPPPRRRGSGKKAVSWSDISGCGLISSPSTHSLPSPVSNSPKPIIKKTTLPPVPQSRSPSPGFRDRQHRWELNRPLRERSSSIPGAWCSHEDSSPSPERHRRDALSRSPPRCGSPRCRSVGDMSQVGIEQEPMRQFLVQATDLLHSLSDLSRQIEQKIPPPVPPMAFPRPPEDPPYLYGAPRHHYSPYPYPPPPARFSWYEPSPLERQLEASCARLEASLRNPPRWQELCEEEPQRPPRRARARWQHPQPHQQLPPLPHHQRPQYSPRAYMRYLLGVRKRIIQSARQENRRKPDEDY
ncbi:protein Shroom-like isoform X2 [Neocloeon triangulifer]|nr:protein Shroom-like isoform X2 [Neocloeon triangulifer]